MPGFYAKLKEWLSPPRFADEEQTTFARIIWGLCLVLVAALAIPAAMRWSIGDLTTARPLSFQALMTLVALWLARRGRLQSAASLLFFSLLGCAICLLWASATGIHDPATMMMFPALLVLAAILPRWRFYFWFAVAELLAVMAVGVAVMRGWTQAGADARAHTDPALLVEVGVVLIVTAVTGAQLVRQLRDNLAASQRNAHALRESERQYRTVIESLGEGVAITDEQERFLIANPAAEQIFGMPPGGLAGRVLNEFVAPSDWSKLAEEAGRRRRGEKTSYELQIVRGDGTARTILVTVAPQLDADGRSLRCVGVFRDVTEARQLEQQFRLMAHAMRSINDCVGILDPKLRFLYVNEAFCRTFGYQESEVRRRPLTILRSGRNAPDLLQQIRAATIAGGWQGELWSRAKDGREFPVSLSTSPVRDEQGRTVALAGVARDITERRLADEALKQSEGRFRDLVENTNDWIWELDAKGRYVYCSPAVSEMLGIRPEEILGLTPQDLSQPEDWAAQAVIVEDLKANPRPFRGLEFRHLHRDGSIRVLDSNGVPIRDAAGRFTGYRGMTRDITARNRAEEELRAAKTSAEAADRAKSEFLATISHEIRTPMNGIIGMAELLLGTGLNPEQRNCGEALKSSSEALLAILNDVLDFSKIEAGKVELESIPFDLLACLEEVEDLVAINAHAKHLELALLYGREVPRRVLGDPGRIRQIVLNLVSNAIKFTERGSVWVEVSCPRQDAQRAAFKLTVFDTGIGIPPDKLLQVFTKFTQADSSTRRRYGGTGLGLAIVKRLVERMNGSIEVASQPGEGSAFSIIIELPLAPDQQPGPVPPADLQGARVLIVDDFAINRFVFLDLCLRWGMRPDEASGGAEALRRVVAAAREGDPYRAVLLDSNMPGMDGEDVVRQLRALSEGREPGIVMATSSNQQGEAERYRAAGCDGYLIKPIKSGLLQEALARVLGARSTGRAQPLITDNSLATLRTACEPAPPAEPLPFAGCRALLAEDNLINQKLGIRLLERLGCSVDVAMNGLEAVRLSADNEYDVVFMDCQMPEMDGFEATAEIRRREGDGRRTPIVAVTAYAMDGDRERCLTAGMDDYIPKPIRPGVLERALRTWCSPAATAADTAGLSPEDNLQTLA